MKLFTRACGVLGVGAFLWLAGCSGDDSSLGGGAPGTGTNTSTSTGGSSGGSSSNDSSSNNGTSNGSDAGGSSSGDAGGGGQGTDSGSPGIAGDAGPGGSGTLDGGGTYSVKWNEACWYADSGHKYQAISFTQKSTQPMALEGTLFYNASCDPKDGTDNLNDTGGTQPSGSWTFWFIHHPDQKPTSAVWWIGDQKSACIDYTTAPDCN